jgi:hypothetical protein
MTSPVRILPDLSAQNKAILEELARLREENEALKAAKPTPRLTFKLTEKGGVSVYGLMRFPVTLYAGQWLRLLDVADSLKAFLRQNAAHLSVKGQD